MKSTSILIVLIFSIGLCLLAQQIPDKSQCPPTLSALKSLIDSAKKNYDFNSEEAKQTIVQVKQCLQTQTKQDTTLAKIYHQIGIFYKDKDKNVKEALAFFDKALVIRKRVLPALHPDIANNFYMIAVCKLKQGDYMAVLQNAQDAYNIYNQIQDKTRNLPLSCSLIATSSRYCGDNEKAKTYLYKAIRLCQNLNDTSSLCIVENTLSMVYIKQIKYDSAIQHTQICINLVDDLLKKMPTNKQHYDKLGDYYVNQSIAYRLSGNNNDKALASALTALKMYNQNPAQDEDHAKRIANAHIEIGNCYAEKRDWATAAKEYSTALTLFEKAKLLTSPYYAEAFMSMGKAAAGQNNHLAALAYYQKALKVLQPDFKDADFLQNPRTDSLVFAPMELMDVLSAKATSLYKLSQQKSKKEAPQYLDATERTLKAIDTLVGYLRLSFSGEESKYDLSDKMRPMYAIGMSLAKSRNNPTDFLIWMERNKALSLQESLKRQQAKSYAGLPEQVLQREQQLKSDVTRWAKAAQTDTTSAGKDNYRLRHFEALQAVEAFEKDLEKEYPRYHDLKYLPTKSLNIATIQAKLPDTMAFLEYALSNDSLFILVASRTQVKTFIEPLPKGFADTFAAFLKTQNNDDGNSTSKMIDFRAKSLDLYNLLLQKPLAAIQGDKPITRLKIVRDDVLNYLPFGSLLEKPVAKGAELKTSQYPYVMQNYAVSYDYSAALSFDSSYQKKKGNATYDFGGFGFKYERVAPHLTSKGKDFGILKRSHQEVTNIQKLFVSSEIWTDLRENMSKTRFLTHIDKSIICHVSGHGYANNDECGLMLPDTSDNILRGNEIYAQTFKNTYLIVLSACQTGIGTLHRGEGMMSFTRALSYAGVPAVAMTLWSVDESSTSDIMKDFHKHLAAGDTKDIALQKAEKAYLQKNNALPYNWAGIAVVGNTDAMTFKKPTNYLPWLLAGSALMSLLFFAFKRKIIRLA